MSSSSSSGSGARMLPLKSALAVTAMAVATTAVLLHSRPSIRRLFAEETPRVYTSILSWMTPPYLYFVLNAIIICIAASSRFHKQHAHSTDPSGFSPLVEVDVRQPEYASPVLDLQVDDMAIKARAAGEEEVEEEFLTPRSSWSLESPTEYLVDMEKRISSGRLSNRKSLNAGHEDMALTKPRREETLESTWRAITEGREHHLRKSDTWDTRASREDRAAVMRESSGIFSGGGSCSPPSWTSTSTGVGRARLRREPSPGQEELNRRVEEFIEKFNEEMRLQRQKSLQKLKAKISSDTTH